MADQPFSDPMTETEARNQDPGRARRQRQARRRRGLNPGGSPLRGDRDSSGMNTPAFKRQMAKTDAQSLRWMLNHGHIKRAQQYLKRKGYSIDVDGLFGPQTRAFALREFRRAGVKPRFPGDRRPRGGGRPTGGGGGGGGGGAPPLDDHAGPSNFGGVPGMDDIGGANTSRMLPRDMADELAGYEFDPQIQELLAQVQQGRRDTAQHQRDIGGWYGQVRGSQETARGRDQEAGEAARTSVNNALQGILQSLGGSRGAGVVGAAGLSDLAAIAAQGASQDRYNADMAPLLAAEEAAAHTRETALGSQRKSALDQALVRARGQRGQSEAKNLLGIIQANNQGRQTNFQNRLAIQNARMAGASLGLQADQTYAGIEAQRAATRQNEAKLRMQSLAQQQESGVPNWARLNYPDRQTVVHDAVGRAAATMAPDHWDNAYVRDRALKLIRAGGYSSARGKNFTGKVNKRNQRQIIAAVNSAVAAAYQAWRAKQGQ